MAYIRKGLEFWLNKDIRRRRFDLMVFNHQQVLLDGKTTVGVAPPLEYKVMEDSADSFPDPTLSLTFEEAEALMSELWGAGVRPSGVGSSGELAAMKYHLEDMRSLVFSKDIEITRKG